MFPRFAESQRNRDHRTLLVLMVALVALMPTYSALAEIYATPVVEPTSTPTPTEESTAPGSTETKEQAESLEIDQRRQSDGAVSPMSVVDSGALENCELDTETIVIGSDFTFWCDLDLNLGLAYSLYVDRPTNLPPGVTASITLHPLPRGNPVTLGHGDSGRSARFDVLLSLGLTGMRAEINVAVNVSAGRDLSFDALFSSRCVGVLASCNGTALLSVNVVPMELTDEHYEFQCSPTELGGVGMNETSGSQCFVAARDGVGGYLVNVAEIEVAWNLVSGWDLEVSTDQEVWTRITSSQQTFQVNALLGAGHSYSFYIRLTPVACNAGSAQPSVNVGAQLALLSGNYPLSDTTQASTGPITATFESPIPTFTALVLSAPEDISVSYRMTEDYGPVYRTLTIRYVVTGCEPWDGYAKMGPFENTSGGSGLVPILDYAKLDTESMASLPGGVSLVSSDADIRADSAVHLVSGVGSGQVDLPFDLRYTIPAGTPGGTYTSTITVTFTSDAP